LMSENAASKAFKAQGILRNCKDDCMSIFHFTKKGTTN
jgi:hypothetical protein